MKRIILWIMVVLVGTSLGAGLAQGSQNDITNDIKSRYRVAVLDFDVTDVTSQEPNLALGRALAETFDAPLVQSKRFTVVTRADLDKVLTEIGLARTGIITPEQIVDVGALSGAEILLTGSIIVNNDDRDSYSITARFIDIATGEVTVAISSNAENSRDFALLAESFVAEVLKDYPRQGRVISVDDDEIFINLGTKTGLLEEDAGGVVYRLRDINGIPFEEEIASFVVTQLSSFASKIAITLLDNNAAIQEDDIVKVTSEEILLEDDTDEEERFVPVLFVERPADIFPVSQMALMDNDMMRPPVASVPSPVMEAAIVLPEIVPEDVESEGVEPEDAVLEDVEEPDMPVTAVPNAAIRVPVLDDGTAESIVALYAFVTEELESSPPTPHHLSDLHDNLVRMFPEYPVLNQQVLQEIPTLDTQIRQEWQSLDTYEQQLMRVGLVLLLEEEQGARLAQDMELPCEDFRCYYQQGYWRY